MKDIRKNRVDSITNNYNSNNEQLTTNKINEQENLIEIKKSKYKHSITNSKSEPVSLIYFRRGLRLEDNTAINAALSDIISSKKPDASIFCLFNFDPRQVGDDNKYKSNHCVK